MNDNFTKLAFSDTVKNLQEKYGSRKAYAKMEESGDRFILTDREKPFIESRDSFYIATVGKNGWPYVQFRGGPAGFLKVLDDTCIGFADFRGNRQFISSGNIIDTNKASLILMDYPSKQRLKIWAEAEVHDASDKADLANELTPANYKASIERVILFRIRAYDWNCPQHITPRYTLDQIGSEIAKLNPEILKSCCAEDPVD